MNEVASAARATNPAWILISISAVIGLASLLPWLENRLPAPIVFGGRLVNLIAPLRERLPDVFLGADARDAIHALATIKPRADFWSPRKRAFQVARILIDQRPALAAETTTAFYADVPTRARREFRREDLHAATAYLVESLACATAFDTPEIIDLDKQFLDQTMPPRAVASESISKYLDRFSKTLRQTLNRDDARQCDPLIARLRERS